MKNIIKASLIMLCFISCKKEEAPAPVEKTQIASFYAYCEYYKPDGVLFVNGVQMDRMNPMQVKKNDTLSLYVFYVGTTTLRSSNMSEGKIYIDNKIVAQKQCGCDFTLEYIVK